MSEQVRAAFALLPAYLAGHVALSAAALVLGLLVGLPLALASARIPAVRLPALGFASLVQTIPSLALLALFYPLLLALSAAARAMSGHGFAALGFLPSLLALSLYALLPILRNGVAGLTGLDPAVVEAARAVGMTPRQRLIQVEAPLAAPVVMAGVRTAAVWVIGAATLSTAVGWTSLGDYIFSGLQTENWVLVLFGCGASAALALITDGLLALVETGLARRSRLRLALGGAGLLAGTVLALAPLAAGAGGPKPYVIGAKNFSEQYILADLMSDRLKATGARVVQRSDLGSVIAFRALAANDLDAYVDYSGTLWTNVLHHADTPPRPELLRRLTAELKARYGVTLLGPLGFENAYVLAMKRDRANALHIVSLSDLAPRAPALKLGSDLEFLSRPEWRALVGTYGLSFRAQTRYQPTFMYRALEGGEADVISAFSSDGRIAADHLVALSDPMGAAPSYDAVILLSPHSSADARLRGALLPLVNRVPVQAMRAANLTVDRDADKLTPQQAAQALAKAIGR
ncbi:ABC transporter permease/substrate-binding protein [Caulobacter sp. S45]|uniref:ABC transporter permease/substrate-binding protein n=1 Tax=Caulobacter sp. S45 TaxID=1641861 RepID=UPI001576E5DB|nr:glycine betaine ABC transporter substrate-binding protein [Caulobacter sp. S45]